MLALLLSLAAFSPLSHSSESVRGDHVRVSWVAPESFESAVPSEIGIRFALDPDWHVYWKNPGDSGAAPKFNFQASGASLGEIQWPTPQRIALGDLYNIGYEKEVTFPIRVTPSQSGSVQIRADLEWLVCKVECIPGFGSLKLERRIRDEKAVWKSELRARIEEAKSSLPTQAGRSQWKVRSASREGDLFVLHFSGSGAALPELFPANGNWLQPSPPLLTRTEQGFDARFKIAPGQNPKESGNILLVSGGQSYELASTPVATPIKGAAPRPESPLGSYALLLFSAFLGGLILNLMPCVFPVLSIKVFSMLKGGQRQVREGLLYTLGVLTTFALLGAGLIALRAAGSSIGWGFQLQHPAIVLGLAALFWLMALNFLGVFEFGIGVMNWAGQVSPRSSSFGAGILSVFVAAPCTGPFMGTALGASAVLPATQAMGIFLSLGAGLAAPILLLSASPRALSRLPRPGVWMDSLKQALAFPLLATVLWLLWVLGRQAGEQGWLLGGALLLSTSFALWLGKSHWKTLRLAAWLIGAGSLMTALTLVSSARPESSSSEATAATPNNWASFDPDEISRRRAAKQAVFIDFTAAWVGSPGTELEFAL